MLDKCLFVLPLLSLDELRLSKDSVHSVPLPVWVWLAIAKSFAPVVIDKNVFAYPTLMEKFLSQVDT